jgi:uncharacterized tellurite resistance protein B-like protein
MQIKHLLEPTDEGLIALCALMLELAHIDGDFSEPEMILLLDLFSREMAQSIVRGEALLARAQARLRMAPDLQALTDAVCRHFDEEERGLVLGLLWQVAWADERLTKYEAYLLRRIGTLLRLPDARVAEQERDAQQRFGRA